jgi:hypothetical protein
LWAQNAILRYPNKEIYSYPSDRDYLTGNTDVLLDTNTLNRILEVQQLPEDVKEKLFYFIDMTVRDYKAKKAYS